MTTSTDRFRILILGSGGREHAFAWKLNQSSLVESIIVIPGNGGTATGLSKTRNTNISLDDMDAVVAFALDRRINLVIPSSEGPLVAGIGDYFRSVDIACFGPSKAAAALEGSKVFAKNFMSRHSIPTASYRTFDDFVAAKAYVETVNHPVVIKASGLAAGKGVLMPNTKEEAVLGLESLMLDRDFGPAGDEVVVEEFLTGDEISIGICSDGYTIRMFPSGQDHQRVYDGNVGPNTGGMGCYAPTPLCSAAQMQEIHEKILKPTIDGMRQEGNLFLGMICIGIIMTTEGPKNLEYNVRFGDPEAQVLFPLLTQDTDLAEIADACVKHRLSEVKFEFWNKCAANVVVASKGYPTLYKTGFKIDLGPVSEGTIIFHAGTTLEGTTLKTSGGRVFAISAIADTLEQAVKAAYEGVKAVSFQGAYFRTDIARRVLEF